MGISAVDSHTLTNSSKVSSRTSVLNIAFLVLTNLQAIQISKNQELPGHYHILPSINWAKQAESSSLKCFYANLSFPYFYRRFCTCGVSTRWSYARCRRHIRWDPCWSRCSKWVASDEYPTPLEPKSIVKYLIKPYQHHLNLNMRYHLALQKAKTKCSDSSCSKYRHLTKNGQFATNRRSTFKVGSSSSDDDEAILVITT